MNADSTANENQAATLEDTLREIRKKGTAARIVLDTFNILPSESVPALYTGWRKVGTALTLFESGVRVQNCNLKDSDSLKIAKINSVQEVQTETVSNLHRKILDGETVVFSRNEGLKHTVMLDDAVRSLTKLRLRYLASPMVQKWQKVSTVMIAAFSISALVLLVVGLYLGLTHPALDEGLEATYFTKPGFQGIRFVVIDHQVNFAWGDGSPLKGVKPDNFSVVWEGCLIVDKGTNARLVAGADDGIRVYIENDKIIDNWDKKGYRRSEAKRVLSPGIYPIKAEYFEKHGEAQVFLGWSLDGADMKIIPYKNLVPRCERPGLKARNQRCPTRTKHFK